MTWPMPPSLLDRYLPRRTVVGGMLARVGIIAVPDSPGLTVSVPEIRQYIAAVDESAKSLNEDQYENLVWQDPEELRAAADRASEYGDASGMYADANTLAKRAKGRSAKQVQKEEEFGSQWRPILGRWNKVKADAGYPDDMNTSSTGLWHEVHDLHKEINIAHDAYEGLGHTASMPKKEEVAPIGGVTAAAGKLGIGWYVAGAAVAALAGAVIITRFALVRV